MRRGPSIRVLVGLIVVIPVVVASAALVTVSVIAGRRVAENLGAEVVDGGTARVGEEIRTYLRSAVRVCDLYALRIARGELPTTNLQSWEATLFDDLLTSPDVASICFANPGGETTWLLWAHGRLELGRVSGPKDGAAIEYQADPATGKAVGQPLRRYQYVAVGRPWYSLAAQSGRATWTPVYLWFTGESGGGSVMGSGYTRPVYNARGELSGVLVVDVTLSALSQYLRTLSFAEKGWIYVVDDQDLLVAASHGAVTSSQGERLRLAQSNSDAAKAVAAAIATASGAGGSPQSMRIKIHDDPARVRVTPLHPYQGINWRVIAVLPESAFLQQARTSERRAVVLGLIAILASVILGLRLSRRLSQPLMKLAEHVKRIGGGDFESRLALEGANEFTELSDETNKMAAGLKERMVLEQSLALAMQVQQSLLPERAAKPTGLDVAGESKYCDETGGDYYDFIDVSELPGDRTLIAVGDVMGHGIAAALLMATARAALRAVARPEGSLGALMTRVNDVIARDARHGKFMTMVLLTVDPKTAIARWASAGHDPVILFNPGSREFRDLDGADVPLGVMENVAYQEYSTSDLPAGGVLVVGTEGIWEARRADGEMYGKDRLKEVIEQNASRAAADIGDALRQSLADFLGDVRPQDDVTFIIVKLI